MIEVETWMQTGFSPLMRHRRVTCTYCAGVTPYVTLVGGSAITSPIVCKVCKRPLPPVEKIIQSPISRMMYHKGEL